MMQKAFVIPVFFDTDETNALALSGKPYSMKICEVRDLGFYHVSAIGNFTDKEDNNKHYGCIHTNNAQFISPLTTNQLIDRLEKHLSDIRILWPS